MTVLTPIQILLSLSLLSSKYSFLPHAHIIIERNAQPGSVGETPTDDIKKTEKGILVIGCLEMVGRL